MTPFVRALLFANIGVYFLQQTVDVVNYALFVFVPQLVLRRPWTLVTYMFLHAGTMHLVFNMLGLFFFGPRVEERLGSRSFLYLYFISGITGALLSLFMGQTAQIIGASGGVFGVMLAFAWFWPDDADPHLGHHPHPGAHAGDHHDTSCRSGASSVASAATSRTSRTSAATSARGFTSSGWIASARTVPQEGDRRSRP